MECLGNVWTRELDNDCLLALRGVVGVLEAQVAIGTKSSFLLQDTTENSLSQWLRLEEKL